MRIVVCGSRTCTDRRLVEQTLDRLTVKLDAVVVIVGDAKGPDRFAYDWALDNGFSVRKFYSDEPVKEMVDEAQAVIVFGEESELSSRYAELLQEARKRRLKLRFIK